MKSTEDRMRQLLLALRAISVGLWTNEISARDAAIMICALTWCPGSKEPKE